MAGCCRAWFPGASGRGGSARILFACKRVWKRFGTNGPFGALKSTFYNEFLKRFDTCQMACLATVGSQGIFEALSIYRGPSENEFAKDQLAALQIIVPHLQTALYTRRKLLALESRVSDLVGA